MMFHAKFCAALTGTVFRKSYDDAPNRVPGNRLCVGPRGLKPAARIVAELKKHRISLSIMILLAVTAFVHAADPPVTANRGDAVVEPLKEQTIYIPYDELRRVFEREGRGVFLPYEQFQELWRAARQATMKRPDEAPPVKALITDVVSEAEVATDVVRVSSRVRIEMLTDGWHQIPLRLGGAAITSARIAGQPARIIAEGNRDHLLLLEKKDGEPEEVELTLEYARAFAKSPGRNSVSFEAPQAPVSRWRVRIPGAGVKVNIHPLIAATEVPATEAREKRPDETVVLAFVGAAPQVRIDWTPRTEGATGLNALISAEAFQRIWVHEGVMRSRTNVAYDISRAPVDQLILEVPAGQKVVGVFDPNIRQWSVEPEGEIQRITVDLFEPARGRQNVVVELERFSGDSGAMSADELEVPVVRAVGADQQRGILAVAVAEGLRVEAVRRFGLMQIDAAEVSSLHPAVPSSERATAEWVLSYRYAALPVELALKVEKIKPRITLAALVKAYVKPDEVIIELEAVYDIQKAGVFRLELGIPQGYSIRNGRGLAAQGVTPAKIESYTQVQSGEARTQVIVNLREKALGKVGFAVDLHKRLDEPDLLRPTGKAVEVSIGFPRIASPDIEHATGGLIVYGTESIRLNPTAADGLRSVSWSEAKKGMESFVHYVNEPSRPRDPVSGNFSYAFADNPFALTLKAERRKPHITARKLLVATVEAGVVKYAATFFYDIRYSGVESLRIDVPARLAAVIQNNTSGVSETVIDPPPDDLAEDYVAWSLRRDKPFKGEAAIRLSWEAKTDPLDIGKSVTIPIPHLVPRNIDRAWGQIALAKAETIDIRAGGGEESESPAGLRPIDPRHDLMDGADSTTAQRAARAFEFHDDWSLILTATRYQLEEIKRTSIERAFIRMVVTRSNQVSAQALYRVRSARQRLAIRLPQGVEFDTDPVRINNRPIPLERGQADEFFVPLVGQTPDVPFLLDIRYTVPSGSLRLACPEFPSEPAAQKTYLGAYLPPEWVFLGSIGQWTDELWWRFGDSFGFKFYPRRFDSDLVSWVTQDVRVTGNPGETFQTDGRFHLFSTLRPLPPPEGNLTLVSIDEDLLSVLIFVVVVVGGLILLRYKTALRFLVVGAFLAVLILLGVFLPTFSRQIVGGVFTCAILTVLVLWLVQYYAWVRPHDADLIARKEARQQVRLARIRAKLAPAPATSVPGPLPPSGTLSDLGKQAGQSDKGTADRKGESGQSKGGQQDE